MTPLDITRIKRNDLDAAFAFWRDGHQQPWWKPEMLSMLMRLFDRPDDLLERISRSPMA